MTVSGGLAVTLLVAVVGACSAGVGAASSARVVLTVYAAASLRGVLGEVKVAYEAAVPGTTLTIATDSSATLRTQIEQGAPADVFLSADQENPWTLEAAGLTDGSFVHFAGNKLVIIIPADNPGGVHAPVDLTRPHLKVVAAGADVPISTYASKAVARLGALMEQEQSFVGAYTGNIVSREQNVQAVVAKIELGEGDAAIVYSTDARAARGIATIDIPDAANALITYAGVVVAGSSHPAEAHAFLEWLIGPGGREALAAFGFLPPT